MSVDGVVEFRPGAAQPDFRGASVMPTSHAARRFRRPRRLAIAAVTAALLAATSPGLAASAAEPPSTGELRVQAGVLLDRLEAIEAELATADVAQTKALTAELDALLVTLTEAVRLRANDVAETTLRQFALVRSSALPRFDIPKVVRVAADPEDLAELDPDDSRSWDNVREARTDAVRARRAAADPRPNDLSAAIASATPGTIILLEPGRHTLVDVGRFQMGLAGDIAIIGLGAGRDACTIHMDRSGELSTMDRLLIRGVTIDSDSTPLVDFRGGGQLVLSEVALSGYNSGAGGSNGVFLSGPATLILDRVLMNGRPGRASTSSMLGNALDVRGGVLVHARQSRFLDNDELGRFSGVTVFDRCIGLSDGRGRRIIGIASEYADGVMAARASNMPMRPRGAAPIDTLTASADDAVVIRIAAGMAPDDRSRVPDRDDDAETTPEAARALVAQLSLATRPVFWISLLADPRPEVRTLAAERVRALLAPAGLPAAHLVIPEAAGLDAITVETQFPGLIVHARVRDWWEKNANAVVWSEAAGAFDRRTP